MSDRGDEDNGRHSRNGSMSGRSDDDRIVTYKRDPHSRSKEASKSPSESPAKMKYRSRSRSRSHHRTRRSRSPRRSRSRSIHKSYKSRYSRSPSYRSRSGSYSPYRGSSRRNRSHSHSPMSSRRRHTGTRENPKENKCLGVFGLSIYTTESQLHHIFSKFGGVTRVQVVIDAKSGRSRGFAFIYFETVGDAKNAKENCSGMEIDGRKIRVDFSITQRAHTPTPGIYMGKPTYDGGRWRGGDDDYYGGGGRRGGYNNYRSYDSRRSPSPYYSSSRDRRSRRYERSRSRSYSPSVVRRGYG